MIKHHPESTMIQAFTAGELPASLSIAVSIHLDLCPHCKAIAAKMTQALADEEFNEELDLSASEDFSAMMANITAEPVTHQLAPVKAATTIKVEQKVYTLPRALNKFADSKWSGLGNIQRARLPLEEGEVHASLLQIGEDSAIPHHTHKGYELTLLLDGCFEDESGRYEKGDFIILNGEHQHSPYTAEGCLCYTVSNAPLHFTSGVSKLLNPIGRFLY